jgi:cytochrome c oxidase cbb3-type subunit III
LPLWSILRGAAAVSDTIVKAAYPSMREPSLLTAMEDRLMSKIESHDAARNQNMSTLPDHEYDGIREEDNPLPRWWVQLFYLTIVFAIVYLPVVHMFDILPGAELKHNVAMAARVQEQRELELEASGALDKDPVAAGQKYFKTFCVSCHGSYAEGGIGPNLTDNYWIHGPAEDSIHAVIANGVAAKGMPTWGPILGDRKIKSLATYVMTLWQSKPPVVGKKAEGTPYDMAAIRKPAEQAAAPESPAKKKS